MPAEGSSSARPSVILATSNGVGMGHLARQSAVALALREHFEPVILSMSPAVPLVLDLGLRGEYCPNFRRGFMPRPSWDAYLADRVQAIVAETGARVFVYDGVVPYYGLLRARAALPGVAFVWMRPGLWRSGANTSALKARRFFDLVIEPGDLASPADQGATAMLDDAVRVPPVTLLEQVPRLPRAEAAARLGLDPSRPAALVTLRTESMLDETPAAVALRTLLRNPDWQVAVTRTPITGEHVLGVDPDRLVLLRGVFPLASYLSAFDAAVVEAGYNSFHEMLHSGLATVFVPTSAAVTDDQVGRARWAAAEGLALFAAEDDRPGVAAMIARVLDPRTRMELSARCAQLPALSGAGSTAATLAELITDFRGHDTTPAERVRLAEHASRSVAQRLLGGPGRSLARRLLGREPESGTVGPLPVTLTGAPPGGPWAEDVPPLLCTDKVTATDLRAGYPVEHLLAGASARYRAERNRILRRYYDVRS